MDRDKSVENKTVSERNWAQETQTGEEVAEGNEQERTKPAGSLDTRKVAGSMNQLLLCNKGENSECAITTAHLVLHAVSLQPSNKQQPGRGRSPHHSIFTVGHHCSQVNRRKERSMKILWFSWGFVSSAVKGSDCRICNRLVCWQFEDEMALSSWFFFLHF